MADRQESEVTAPRGHVVEEFYGMSTEVLPCRKKEET